MYDEKMIMERSGHLSTSGVRSYERTTCLQQKEVSDLLSSKSFHSSDDDRKPLKVLNEPDNGEGTKSRDIKKETFRDVSGTKENENVSPENTSEQMMKHFNFQAVHGCTFNFHFSSK